MFIKLVSDDIPCPVKGFLDSGNKKKKGGDLKEADKKKKDGASSLLKDEYLILDGIAKHIKNIDGKISVPNSILKKAARNVVGDTHEAAKVVKDGGVLAKCRLRLVYFRTLVNDERVEVVDCVLPKDAAAKVKGRYENSIVGFFLGKDLSFLVVQQYVSNTWRKFGFERITQNDDGVYLFKFATKSYRDQVIQKGLWLILKSPIILSKWSPSVSLKRGEVTKVPVWVKLYNILVLEYSEDGLSLLGTQICKPIMLDAFNSSMCVESWGRISFARALIEIDAAVGLKKEVIMAIPDEEGDGYIKEVVRVEYEWNPLRCVDCKSFGHDTTLCPKRVREEVHKNSTRDAKTTISVKNDDGFTDVKSRKKNKGANFGGIRLNKPKSKVMWQQKKGLDAKSNSTSLCASSNAIGNDQGVSNPGLNTSNLFDVLDVDGIDMGESETQPKVSEYVSSDLNENRKETSKPSSTKSVHGDGHKDKNVNSPSVLKKWDVINEDDTTDDDNVFTLYGGSLGGDNQLEDEDFDFYGSYADQVVDLDDALKDFRDYKLRMSGRK
nr:hypothetical protein [Tanacetum cinerariifolium]